MVFLSSSGSPTQASNRPGGGDGGSGVNVICCTSKFRLVHKFLFNIFICPIYIFSSLEKALLQLLSFSSYGCFFSFFFKYNFHISLSVSVIRYLLLKYAHTQKKLDALGASVHFLKVRTSLENLGSVLVDLLGNEDLFGVFLDHGLENQGKKGQ